MEEQEYLEQAELENEEQTKKPHYSDRYTNNPLYIAQLVLCESSKIER